MNESLAYARTNRLHERGPKTLILDLDETLVHSWEDPFFLDDLEIYSDPAIYRKFHPNGSQQICYSILLEYAEGEKRIWGLHRPHLYEFLNSMWE